MNILIVHYNTPKLTECLVKSINRFVGTGCTIYIFDNSTKSPFTYRQDNLVLLDNTKGDIINFDVELRKYPEYISNSSKSNGYASFKHCLSVDKSFDLIDDSFVLLDSDVLLKKDISLLCLDKYVYSGEIEYPTYVGGRKLKPRVLPYCCFINVNECRKRNIRYFNSEYMLGINKRSSERNLYDTGSYFNFITSGNDIPKNQIKINDYIVHLRSASFDSMKSNKREEKFLNTYKHLYEPKQEIVLSENTFNTQSKRVIYTCITGNYEPIMSPSCVDKNFDYVCFTDNMNQYSSVWQLRPIPDELKSLSPVKQQRVIKICPHKYLSDYDESLWVDGNIDVLGNISEFVRIYCSKPDKSIFIRRHPNRKCIYTEAKTCISIRKDTAEHVNPQIEKYKAEDFPKNCGLVETGIIYLKHNIDYCKKIMDLWAEELIQGSHRDQLSFNYVLWKLGSDGFEYLDSSLLKSKYFKLYSHSSSRKKKVQHKLIQHSIQERTQHFNGVKKKNDATKNIKIVPSRKVVQTTPKVRVKKTTTIVPKTQVKKDIAKVVQPPIQKKEEKIVQRQSTRVLTRVKTNITQQKRTILNRTHIIRENTNKGKTTHSFFL